MHVYMPPLEYRIWRRTWSRIWKLWNLNSGRKLIERICEQGCTNCGSLAVYMQENVERMRNCRGNEEGMRKWREILRFTLYIASFSLYFLPPYPFPISKIVSFFRKMLNTALLSRMSQKTSHCEKKILGGIYCEKAPLVVRASLWIFFSAAIAGIFSKQRQITSTVETGASANFKPWSNLSLV